MPYFGLPIGILKRRMLICLCIFLLGLALSVSLSPYTPERFAVLYDGKGQGSTFVSKWTGLLLAPGLGLFFSTLAWSLLPLFPSYNAVTDQGRAAINMAIVDASVTCFVLHLLYLRTNVGNPEQSIPLGLVMLIPGVAQLLDGYMLAFVEPNGATGIRTPFALRDRRVWDATHSVASRLYLAAGALSLLSAPLLPDSLATAAFWTAYLLPPTLAGLYSAFAWWRGRAAPPKEEPPLLEGP